MNFIKLFKFECWLSIIFCWKIEEEEAAAAAAHEKWNFGLR